MEMKLAKTLSVTIVALAFFVAVGAAARSRDGRSMVLHYDATVAGSHLASGEYDITWETHSPEATVSFMKQTKVVATAEGKVVDRGRKYAANQVVYDQNADGARVIREIRFGGSSEVIVFSE